jgi:hypothetical protein
MCPWLYDGMVVMLFMATHVGATSVVFTSLFPLQV